MTTGDAVLGLLLLLGSGLLVGMFRRAGYMGRG